MRSLVVSLCVALTLCICHEVGAQWSKPVVVLKGSVTDKKGKPVVAKVSVRDAADTTKEIGNSTSNSATAKYLVILQPSQNYVVKVGGDSLIAQSMPISTPAADRPTDMIQNFTVQFVQPMKKKPAKVAKAAKPKKSAKKKK
jgi:hypothetical protein